MSVEKEAERLRSFVIVMRYMQFIFLAILFYGVAMLSYELIKMIPGVEISNWAVGCSVFGTEGVITSFLIIRSMERKIEKFLRDTRGSASDK